MSSKILCPNCSLSSRFGVILTKQSKSVHTISSPLSTRAGNNIISKSNSTCQSNFPSSHRAFSGTPTTSSGILKTLASRKGGAAETYVSYGFTQKLYEACSAQADYKIPQLGQKDVEVPKTAGGEDLGVGEGWWYKELGLLPTFSTWSQITFLHMYLLTVRLRALPSPESVQTHSRHLIDHFSLNAEQRMATLHNISSRSIRNKYLKDLFIQWRGVLAAYDEGLVKGDAVLGAAVWRNIWKASGSSSNSSITPQDGGEQLDWANVALVVAYMRRVLSELSKTEEADLVTDLVGKDWSIFGYKEIDAKGAGKK